MDVTETAIVIAVVVGAHVFMYLCMALIPYIGDAAGQFGAMVLAFGSAMMIHWTVGLASLFITFYVGWHIAAAQRVEMDRLEKEVRRERKREKRLKKHA